MPAMYEPTRHRVSAFLVDARGKACPAPIIELAKALRAHASVELWADDPAAWADLEAFGQATGHRIEWPADAQPILRAVIDRAERP